MIICIAPTRKLRHYFGPFYCVVMIMVVGTLIRNRKQRPRIQSFLQRNLAVKEGNNMLRRGNIYIGYRKSLLRR